MDNKDIKGQQDRDRVAGNEDYEVNYMAQKMNVSAERVREAIAAVGNNRDDIEAFLNKQGR